MGSPDWDNINLQRHHRKRQQEEDREADLKHQRDIERELQQYWHEQGQGKRDAHKRFIEGCMKEIKSHSSFSNSLYDSEDHRNEIRQALEFIYDNARSAWSEHHRKKASDDFDDGIFKDMLVSNLSGKAGSIVDALESTESKALFLKNRGIMNGIKESCASEAEKERAERRFYEWRRAYIADIIYHQAIGSILDHLKITGKVRNNIKYLLRTGAIRQSLSQDEKIADFNFWEGHMVVPPRKYLLHNEDIVDAVNHMNSIAEGKLLPRPLSRASKFGRKKSVIYKGEDLTRFGLELK